MAALREAGIQLDRKVLAGIAMHDAPGFKQLTALVAAQK
jgi:ribosomal protein L20